MGISIKVAGASFSKIVAAYRKAIRFASLGGFSETPNGGFYDYARASGTGALSGSSLHLPASTDGFIEAQFAVDATSVLLATNSPSVTAYTNAGALFGIYPNFTGGSPPYFYKVTQAGTGNIGPNAAPTLQYDAGDIVRLRRAGITWYAEISKDGGANYTLLHTYSNTSGAAVYMALQNLASASISFAKICMSQLATE